MRAKRSDYESIGDSGASWRTKSLLALAVAALLFVVALCCTSSTLELPLAEIHVPLLGRTRNAQRLADNYRHDFLTTKLPHIQTNLDPPPEGCEATVLLLRHCEKNDIREHCDLIGYERSVYLASLFGDGDERWPTPSFLYAEGPGARSNPHKLNFREIETIGPLAHKTGVTVSSVYTSKTVNHLANELLTLLQSGALCGKLAVVVWKHSQIGHLAHHLGCGPMQGCPLDYSGRSFDDVWEIRFAYRNYLHSTKKSLKVSRKPEWHVFGSVQQEHFDPLAFSKVAGDYPPGGASTGASWLPQAVQIPEREAPEDTSVWQRLQQGSWPTAP